MRLSRAAINGIGSAAGVAWPLFGIIFSILGGSIGGILSLTLGAISTGLFCLISIPIFYFSYQEMENNALQFEEQLQKNQKKLCADITNYINSIYENFLNHPEEEDFSSYLKKMLNIDLYEIAKKDTHSPLYQILLIIKQQIDKKQLNLVVDKQAIVAEIAKHTSGKSIPYSQLLTPSFFGFVGTFGSIAGCSAGISGLLTGIGVFTSFAVFPLLGWSIIGVAVICGAIIAYKAAVQAQVEFQRKEQNLLTKKMHQQLSQAILGRSVDTALHYTSSAFSTDRVKEQELFNQINQPISSLFHTKKLNGDKSVLSFISFFNVTSQSIDVKDCELDRHFYNLTQRIPF